MNRGEIRRLKGQKRSRGHEQRVARFAVVLQADELAPLSTVIIAPTSGSAPPRMFRPEIEIEGRRTRVLLEQNRAVDHSRLGALVGSLSRSELEDVDVALRRVLGLDA
jgi:mRNA interferase MazF